MTEQKQQQEATLVNSSTTDVNRSQLYEHLLAHDNSRRITAHLAEGFEAALFDATLHNLSDKGNKVRFNNFAYCMREVITIILSRYSSDEEITNCSWYLNETRKENGVTRAQRVKYAIHGGISTGLVEELLNEDGEEISLASTLLTFSRLFRNLNEHTHMRESRFDIGDDECERLAGEVLAIVSNILELIESVRANILSRLQAHLDNAILSEFIGSTFDEVDILSTHSIIDEVSVENYLIAAIDSRKIHIKGGGTAYVELQWGSNSDMKRGDGACIGQSFPFDFNARASLNDIQLLEMNDRDIQVNTSSWYK